MDQVFYNTTFPDETSTPVVYTYGERVFVAIVVLLVALFGCIGNVAVILAVTFSRKLQNSTYVFVTNLAVCDLMTCVFLPWSAVALLSSNGWPLPRAEWLCSASAFMVFACVITSMYNLAAVGFNRYILVCHRFKTFTKTFSNLNIYLMVGVSWFIPFSVVLILPLAGLGQLGYDEFGGNGCTDIDSHPKSKLYQYAQVIASAFPLVAIVVCYSLIFIHVKRHFKRQRRTMKNIGVSASVDLSAGSMEIADHSADHQQQQRVKPRGEIPAKTIYLENSARNTTYRENPAKNKYRENSTISKQDSSGIASESETELNSTYHANSDYSTSTINTRRRKQRKLKRQQLQVTGRLFLIVCAFFICITPYCIVISIEGVPQRFIIYTSLLTVLNSAINPLIYSLAHPHFKEIFVAMFKCRFGDIPQPSNTLRRLLKKK